MFEAVLPTTPARCDVIRRQLLRFRFAREATLSLLAQRSSTKHSAGSALRLRQEPESPPDLLHGLIVLALFADRIRRVREKDEARACFTDRLP